MPCSPNNRFRLIGRLTSIYHLYHKSKQNKVICTSSKLRQFDEIGGFDVLATTHPPNLGCPKKDVGGTPHLRQTGVYSWWIRIGSSPRPRPISDRRPDEKRSKRQQPKGKFLDA
ncbi:uncharacterized protein LOC121467623 [Drosophila elegans]|uniref:uncharacterized protein LOC121467623 n=1 Tax=Drosophila elegans TaxID=30023 RepID=UPI001BC846DC|nr:uncharacterized protein LOC121467623 [Drosophila elegans]